MKNAVPFLSLIITSLVTALHPHYGFAYSIVTHQGITVQCLNVIEANLDIYLQRNLAISLTNVFSDIDSGQTKSALDWISAGSIFEDGESILDITQPRKHFHNPITNSGLSDTFSGVSSVDWALYDPGNQWSWTKTRDYLHQALTGQTESERNNRFAKMFRALGQVLHLIQDASVPEHVRNDIHLFSVLPVIGSNAYESWVTDHIDPLSFSAALFPYPTNFSLRSFWDADQYINSPTQQGPFSGLTEFTNFNFFSEDTIFTENNSPGDKHYFPHPRKEFTDAVITEETAEDGQIDKVRYVKGYLTEHLAAYSYMDVYIAPLIVAQGWRYNLDPNVYQEYASILIHKAISYSAGLLDYFFRGEMDMVKDPNTAGQYVIQNKSAEPMSGTFSLYYDDTSDTRRLVTSWSNLSINPNSQSTPVSFTAPTSPQPKEQGKYILVFNGTLGNEEGAVVGALVSVTENTSLYFEFAYLTHPDIPFNFDFTVVYWDLVNDVQVNLVNVETNDLTFSVRHGAANAIPILGPIPLPFHNLDCNSSKEIYLGDLRPPFGIESKSCEDNREDISTRTSVTTEDLSDFLDGYVFLRGDRNTGIAGGVILGINHSTGLKNTTILQNEIVSFIRQTTSMIYRFGVYPYTNNVLNDRIEGDVIASHTTIMNTQGQITYSGSLSDLVWAAASSVNFHPTRHWILTTFRTTDAQNLRITGMYTRVDSFEYNGTDIVHLENWELPNLAAFILFHTTGLTATSINDTPGPVGFVTGDVVK